MKPPALDQLSLSPRVPRVDIEPVSLSDSPPTRFVVCPVCSGSRVGLGCEEYGWRKCTVCDGQGKVGGAVAQAPAPRPAERCWLCNGSGTMLDDQREPFPCDCCGGRGQIGGGP